MAATNEPQLASIVRIAQDLTIDGEPFPYMVSSDIAVEPGPGHLSTVILRVPADTVLVEAESLHPHTQVTDTRFIPKPTPSLSVGTVTIDLVARMGDGEPSILGTLTIDLAATATQTPDGIALRADVKGQLGHALIEAGKQLRAASTPPTGERTSTSNQEPA